jgi:hypothetical protein
MPYPDQQQNTGLYVPTTSVWDMGLISDIDTNSAEFKDLLVRLYQNINNIVLSLNLKRSGYYMNEEFVTGEQFFNPVDNSPLMTVGSFDKTFYAVAIGAGVTNIPHGLTVGTTWEWIRIYGALTDNIGFNGYPLPFASVSGTANIEVRVDSTNIIITNSSGVTFTSVRVIIDYLKN